MSKRQKTEEMAAKAPVRVLITGAAGQIAYSLIPLFAGGQVLGEDQPIILHLLDIEMAKQGLEGVVMEITDCAYPLVAGVVATTKPEEGFKDIDYAVLLGGFPRLKGMTRADLLAKNCEIFVAQGAALGDFAKPTCKVLVVANPANTNALIAYKNCKGKIPAANFTCLTRLDQNRAVGQVKAKLAAKGRVAASVDHLIIWGNHSQDQFPDLSHGVVKFAGGKEEKVSQALADDEKFLSSEFITTVQMRGSAVIAARGKSSACSAANAVKDHMHDWVLGTGPDQWVSMGVVTDGSFYGLPADLVFSVPCTTKDGTYTVVQGLTHSSDGEARIKLNVEKLTEEFTVSQQK